MTLTRPISVHAATLPASDREIALLRTLGRLGIVPVAALHALVLPDRHRATFYRTTQRMRRRGLIWDAPAPRVAGDGGPPPAVAGVYGLTVDGKQLLDALQVEPAGIVFDRLIARDRRAPPPGEAALVHDMVISTWCASVLDMARRTPMLVGAICQARVQIAAGELRQTLDAVLTLIFDSQQRTFTRPGWQLPWFDGEAVKERYRVLRFALVVDTGKASSTSLIEQAKVFALLAQGGTYTSLFGGPLRPVILVPPGERGNTVASAWADGWPQTPAVLSSTVKAQHPQYGALWGTYYTVRDRPAQATTLPAGLVPSVEQWTQLTSAWTPGGPM